MPARPSSRSTAAAVVAGYLAITLWFSWPLAAHLTTSLAGDWGDAVFTTWVMTWVSQHLFAVLHGDLGAWNAMWSAPIFAPDANTLTYSEHFIGQTLQALPIFAATYQPLLAFNVLWIATFALAGVAAHRLAHAWSGSHLAGVVAGVTCMFTDFRLAFSISHLHTLSVHWWLFGLWGLDRFAATSSGWALAGATLSLTLLHLSSNYLMAYCAPFTGAFAVWTLWRHGRLRDLGAWIGAAGAGATSIVLVLPVVLRYLATRDALNLTRSLEVIAENSSSLATYRAAAWSIVPLVCLAIAGVAAPDTMFPRITRRARLVLAALAMAAIALSFGPVMQFDTVHVPGPYRLLLDYVPGFAGLRVAQRFEVIAMALVSLLGGLGAAWLGRHRVGLVVAIGLTLMAVQPARTSPFVMDRVIGTIGPPPPPPYLRPSAATPPIYTLAKSLPADAVLIELPFGDIGYDIRYTYFTLAHGHRIVNGYSGIFTPLYLQRAGVLAQPFANPELSWVALQAATHVIVHTAGFAGDAGTQLRAALRARGARELGGVDGAWIYELPKAPAPTR